MLELHVFFNGIDAKVTIKNIRLLIVTTLRDYYILILVAVRYGECKRHTHY